MFKYYTFPSSYRIYVLLLHYIIAHYSVHKIKINWPMLQVSVAELCDVSHVLITIRVRSANYNLCD